MINIEHFFNQMVNKMTMMHVLENNAAQMSP